MGFRGLAAFSFARLAVRAGMAGDGAGCAGRAPRAGAAPLLARLLTVLTGEIDALEAAPQEISGRPAGARKLVSSADAKVAGSKGRIEAIGQATRTLEKLLELQRLEALAMRGGGDEDGEAGRLAEELMKRLRALDARRGRPTLFAAEEGDTADPSHGERGERGEAAVGRRAADDTEGMEGEARTSLEKPAQIGG